MSPRIHAVVTCIVLVASLSGALSAQAGGIGVEPAGTTVILDASDVRDWARVSFSYHWKDQDAILHPYALLKFDLADVPATALVLSAALHFHVESTQAGGTVDVHHVADDSWDFLTDTPAVLHAWPTDHLIQSYVTGTTGWKVVNVTTEVAGEVAGDGVLSLKWEDAFQYLPERITSPSSLDSRHRPFLKVRYASVLPVGNPDLTLGPCDIELSDATPMPGQLATVTVTARNTGSLSASGVDVSLYDGVPPGGVLVGSGSIASIPGGGGAKTITFPMTTAAGRHRLFAVLDPDESTGEADEDNNVAFRDVDVLSAHDVFEESFETSSASGSGVVWHGGESGINDWVCDADVPFDPNIDLARQWRIMRTRTESYDGHGSLSMAFDGGSDDGTVWVERWIPVDPGTSPTVDVSWAFGIQSNLATSPVSFVGTYDPEVESDFTWHALQDGWAEYSVSEKVTVPEECERLWVAVGFTVTWETPVWHYLDDIRIVVQ